MSRSKAGRKSERLVADPELELERRIVASVVAAERLIEHLAEVARERGWGVVRWITADDNDRLARKTAWNLYELTP